MEKITRSCPEGFTVDKIGRIKSYTNKQNEIRTELKELTNGHCSYCDGLIYEATSYVIIEHYKPINEFPNLEKIWHNLFASCSKCNNSFKRDFYPKVKPLKPDTDEYSSFEKWFEIDFEKYEIRPNKFLNFNDKERARTTINWFGLNDYDRIKARKNEYETYKKRTTDEIENYSYRFFIRIMLVFDNELNK